MTSESSVGRLLYSLESGYAEEVVEEWADPKVEYFETENWVYLSSEYGKHWVWDDERRVVPPIQIEQDALQDNVNHPSHYTSHPSGVECITIVRHYNFNVGGAIKYLWRNGLKDEDAQIEDLQKAIWLIEDEIKRLQETASKDDLTAGYYV